MDYALYFIIVGMWLYIFGMEFQMKDIKKRVEQLENIPPNKP